MSVITTTRSFIARLPYWWLYAIGIVLFIVSGTLWWTQVYMSPDRVFWGMINNSLSTRGVTVETDQQGQGSAAQQYVQFELGDVNKAYSLTKLAQGSTKVETEIIGTTDADYYRYRSIETDQKGQDGKKLDTSQVEGIWAKSEHQAQTETQSGGQKLFAQAVLGIGLSVGSVPVPIGDLQHDDRHNMVEKIRNRGVYEANYKDVKKEKRDGRVVYTYKVKIQTILYVQMMKQFAGYVGLKELDTVDANSYQTSAPMEAIFTVDAASRHLVAAQATAGGTYNQRYSGYNVPLNAEVPTKTIPIDELNKRLQEL